jgi:hypothetical protein
MEATGRVEVVRRAAVSVRSEAGILLLVESCNGSEKSR